MLIINCFISFNKNEHAKYCFCLYKAIFKNKQKILMKITVISTYIVGKIKNIVHWTFVKYAVQKFTAIT